MKISQITAMPESQPELPSELPAILSHKGRLAIIFSMLVT